MLALMIAAIDLIEEHRGDSPLILLDDVDSELDGERRDKLFELLFTSPRQIFISGTDFSRLELGNNSARFLVHNGQVERAA